MHLNCHSAFSLKYGVVQVKSLLQKVSAMGITSLALTDINNTSACIDFIRLAPRYGIKPVVGIDFRDNVRQHFIAIAKNNEGFKEINEYLTSCQFSGEPISPIAPHFKQVIVIYPFQSGLVPNNLRAYEYIGVRHTDLSKLPFSKHQSQKHKFVALQSASFFTKTDFKCHRLLRAIGENTLISKLLPEQQASCEDLYLAPRSLLNRFKNHEQLVETANRLLHACSIDMEFGTNKNLKNFTGTQKGDMELLRNLALEGAKYRYGMKPPETIQNRIEKELKVIAARNYNSYFLISWDLLTYARSKGYFYVGRGSGANSLVAYCLRITDVDPVDLDLYFERFINPSRESPPDFDIDFSWKDRDDVINYIFNRYPEQHVAMIATYNTFQKKALVRELGKVFGLPKHEIDKMIDPLGRLKVQDKIAASIAKYSEHLHDLPNYLSVHAGGILISEKPLTHYSAMNMPPKGFPITQFSMLEAEDVGLFKLDILSQRGLGHIRETIEIVKESRGRDIDIHNIAAFKEDEAIKERLRKGDTVGCFYIESPAMRQLLKKLRCDTYLGLVAASSIIRPGVAQSGMMREYILRFHDEERRKDAHPVLFEIMPDTFGVMVYQEDVIKVAHYFADLSLSDADVLRRGMSGKYRSRQEFQVVRDKFFHNCIKKKGYSAELTQDVWRQIESFAGYAFAKGHSASYAVESYQSLYLKTHFPLEFMVGVVNNFGGFYSTEVYLHEAKMAGANILAPCINQSEWMTRIDGIQIFIGFVHLKHLEKKLAKAIIEERKREGDFIGLEDFSKRVSVSLEQLSLLIRIDAFRFTGMDKKELLWEAHILFHGRKKTEIKKELFKSAPIDMSLPKLEHKWLEDAYDQLEILGFPLISPFKWLQERPKPDILAKDMVSYVNKEVAMLGYLIHIKKTSTSKKERMFFGTWIDEKGHFIDSVHFPIVARQYPFNGRGCYLMQGKVTEEFNSYSLEVKEMRKLALQIDE